MRRVLLIIFAILVVACGAFFFYLRYSKLKPTPFNWRASVLTVAGDGAPAFRGVPKATEAGFSDPFGVAVARDGTIYISDAGESNRIRKLSREGTLTTIAGGPEGFADGTQASFNTPSGLVLDRKGNIYVADTGNNRIRKITPEGVVSTVAGNGNAGLVDGPAPSAEFNGPIGITIDDQGNLFVADSYNDRIRKITSAGQVTTEAGVGGPGDLDGPSASAQFDTPCGVAVLADGTLIVADTGNNKLRKISAGQVTTLTPSFVQDPSRSGFRSPLGLAVTHDGFLYVTEQDRGTIIQIAPDGRACVLAGNGPGYADGFGSEARLNHPAGIAINPRSGELFVADVANYLIRKVSGENLLKDVGVIIKQVPKLTSETLGQKNLLWPLNPQDKPHEVVATVGEVRGSFESTDSRDHLHSGLDVSGLYGDAVRAIRSEKVTGPLPNWGFGELSEGLRTGVISYIHMQVGRDKDGKLFNDSRFIPVSGNDGKLWRIRVRRGTRFYPGDALGTINRMYHVHLIVGPSGSEINPLSLSPIGFSDTVTPTIEKDGVQLFNEAGQRLSEREHSRLLVDGRLRIVVDAFDRNDMNGDRRRLGLYSLGYQVLQDVSAASTIRASTTQAALVPAPGFASPLTTIIFNRLPADDNAPKLAYATESGITVYGSKTTRFLYEITNTIRDGQARAGVWDTTGLVPGDYILRVIVADYSGNQTHSDLAISKK